MSTLTKEERSQFRTAVGDGHVFQPEDMEAALDTIDALEAERDEAQDIIRSCYEILEDAGLSAEDTDGCGLTGIVFDLVRGVRHPDGVDK